jgi:predicted transcriptional regulator
MKDTKLYAVITGDIVNSSSYIDNKRSELMNSLRSTFQRIETLYQEAIYSPFEVHRGDSFQGVLLDPAVALSVAITIRARLRLSIETERRKNALDTRIAIGIGTIDYLPERGGEGDGLAYRRSGPILDGMKGERYLLITTPVDKINTELEVECFLLDAILRKWSREQSEAVIGTVRGMTQVEIANNLNISQPAVGSRLKGAGYWAIERFITRYKKLTKIINQGTYNPHK